MNQDDRNKALQELGKYGSIAIQMLVIILAGTFLGYFLDKWLHMNFPVFKLVCILLSVFLSLFYVLKDLLKKK